MTEEETKKFGEMLLGIARHKNKRFIEIGKNEQLMVIPLADVLAQIRGFTNYVKTKEKVSK